MILNQTSKIFNFCFKEKMKFNNVFNSLKTSLAIVLVFILASCAKQLPKPSKEVKSVLVIPAEVVNKTQM